MALPPDGSLWREQGRPEVYWIRDGERLHIPNPYVMEALNLDWNAVQTVPPGSLDHVPLDLSWAPLGNATPGSVVHVPQDVGFAWNDPAEAIADAKSHIDRFGLRSQGMSAGASNVAH